MAPLLLGLLPRVSVHIQRQRQPAPFREEITRKKPEHVSTKAGGEVQGRTGPESILKNLNSWKSMTMA